jgi:hypothetical protein
MRSQYWIEASSIVDGRWLFVQGTLENKSWVEGYFACLKDLAGKDRAYRLMKGKWTNRTNATEIDRVGKNELCLS